MASETKININSVHLVPAAAVWQAPKIILALLKVSTTHFVMVCCLFGIYFGLSNTVFFNKGLRLMMEDYELCVSRAKIANPEYTSVQEGVMIRECYAAAKARSLSKKSQ